VKVLTYTFSILFLVSCASRKTKEESIVVDRFADIQILKLEVKSWDKLTPEQRKYAYFLSEAGLSGRDIIYDQNNAYNLRIRKFIEQILVAAENEDRNDENWKKFEIYAKQIFFSNGIHHHYSMDKIQPQFSESWLLELCSKYNIKYEDAWINVIFDPFIDAKRKVKDPDLDMVVASANNFYGPGVTQEMVEKYYAERVKANDPEPIEWGLNSTMEIGSDGKPYENYWRNGGKYSGAIQQIIYWLKQAVEVTENYEQRVALEKLIAYYNSGDLRTWDEYNIAWTQAVKGDIDYINGFIEVYGDALGRRASFESIVQINDFEASAKMAVLAKKAQWFEDNSPIMFEHKKPKVVGVTYKVVEVVSEAGDAAPSTPIGVNLPNNNWIRQNYGSKSVSLGNIIAAYEAAGGPAIVEEFAFDQQEIDRAKLYAGKAAKMHTALHEVIGHASGQINKGVGQPSETLKNYASTLEEARADLVGLYYIMDEAIISMGLIESLEVGKAEYDAYIRNGLLTQLQRLTLGQNLEEEHMQNRQLVASWVFEKGKDKNVIERIEKNGKTYFKINDYMALRALFGELLREIQRIKSEGDYESGKLLVETYGVRVDSELHTQVLERVAPLNIAPYNGFVYPVMIPIYNEQKELIDVRLEYTQSFLEQMLYYGQKYSFE
jgi:dipeptidyl-peptidase-3